MADIYSNTTHGLIWLGEDYGDGAAALKGVTAIYEEACAETDNCTRLYETMHDRGDWCFSDRVLSENVDFSAMIVVTKFYNVPWFQRLWCVQEAALPKESTCYYGYFELPLMKILIAARWLIFKGFQVPINLDDHPGVYCAGWIQAVADHDRGFCGKNSIEDMSLFTLLTSSAEFKSLDPRDHVFSLVGLYRRFVNTGKLPTWLQPDYTKPTVEVFRDAARAVIMERDDLRIFHKVATGRSRDGPNEDAFPSWVPRWDKRWSKVSDVSGLALHFRAGNVKTKLNGVSRTDTGHQCSDMNILCIEGSMVATISESTEAMSWEILGDVIARSSIIASTRDMLQRHAAAKRRHEVESCLAMTLCGGADHLCRSIDEEDARRSLDSLSDIMLRTGEFPAVHGSPAAENASAEEIIASKCRFAMQNACIYRRAFVTDNSHPGLGPMIAGRGDVVAVLYGCRWPVILRPRQENGHYEFLDVAYVHGIMHGEAVREHEAAGKPNDVFHIH
ncbi:hypothetical protein B0A48_17839 [Cryoendolithus antarcticus]|uniref:Uncharacterized protein n=1 Tax=Cryoendolithus antarcticus TaxID=1507870 RepID=A0A1V8SB69_9PEZI|nr:hypothetical protein B0A48_17839 [Cryoendolithus antarcticus]